MPDNAEEMVLAIEKALSECTDECGGFWRRERWSRKGADAQLRWVQIRMAPLLIIWMRGGSAGFSGLGKELDMALHQIDR
ncbi:hypothetical protein NBRC116601_11950 [Cognatishimia sp. WU-CL00825]